MDIPGLIFLSSSNIYLCGRWVMVFIHSSKRNLKKVLLFGQQGAYTKIPCFLCEYDISNQYWMGKYWLWRKNLNLGRKNAIRQKLVHPKQVLLPCLPIKLKQFVDVLVKNRDCFRYLIDIFSAANGKMRTFMFVDPDIKWFIKDRKFEWRNKFYLE